MPKLAHLIDDSQLFSIDELPRPALLLGEDGLILKANQLFFKYFSLTAIEVGNFWALCHPDDQTNLVYANILAAALAGANSEPKSLELRIKTGDQNHWLAVHCSLKGFSTKFDFQKTILATFARTFNYQEFLANFLENLPSMVGYWDRHEVNLYSNSAYLKYFGKSPNQIIGMHLSDLVGPEVYKSTLPFIEGVLQGKPQSFERSVTLPNGKIGHTQVRYIPDIRENEVHGFFTYVNDITELIDYQKRIEQKKKNFEFFLEALNTAAIVAKTDTSGKITYVNDAFCSISGFSREELLGQTHRVIKSNLHSAEFYRDLWRTIKSGKVWQNQICNRKKDGTFYWVNGIILPVLDQNDRILEFVSVRIDITREKELEHSAIINSKLASLGEMASDIAHEISNPLAFLIAKLSRLEEKFRSGKSTEECHASEFALLTKSCNRIDTIVKSLRGFSRNDSSDPMLRCSVDSIVDETLIFCRQRVADAQIELSLSVPPELFIHCHPTQISQVILNLIQNAVDAMGEINEKWIKISACTNHSNEVEISVADSGPGLSKELANKIMEPFFSTKSHGNGTGLGLSISKKVAEIHKGRFYLDSDSTNTRFVLVLPGAK
jgi:PAS domain S-box-containing protein